jgi:hypothetical protein
MGNLKPGTSYIYERNGDEIYAREFGETDRTLIGYDYTADPRTSDGRPLHEHMKEDQMWGEIRRMARTNPTLQDAMDRVIMLYNLIKEENKNIPHHPV